MEWNGWNLHLVEGILAKLLENQRYLVKDNDAFKVVFDLNKNYKNP